jgi:proline iminopeptidase
VALIQSDTKEVVDYLLKRFNRDKLFLVGYSWGGILGLDYAKSHPERLYAYISVSALIYGNESERETLDILFHQAVNSNHVEAIAELSEIEIPFGSWKQLYLHRKWITYFSDDNSSKKATPKKLFENWSIKWMEVFQEASSINHLKSIRSLDCPVYFFLSENDLVSNFRVSQKFYNNLVADKKEIIWFKESGHTIPIQEPNKFSWTCYI